MDLSRLTRMSDTEWRIEPHGAMRVPGVIYADESLVREMDEKVFQQVANVAALPGIVAASYAMPDAHWGYGFPIGGVAAFDPETGGVISAGGVGFDISCGVRTMLTGLRLRDIDAIRKELAENLFKTVPAGVGSTGKLTLDRTQMDEMLRCGAEWAVRRGFGDSRDLEMIEEGGCMAGADPSAVSDQAKRRQHAEMGTLGSGNHYLEVQLVSEIFREETAAGFGIAAGDIVVSIHCGSRGLGHQIGTEFLRKMVIAAKGYGIDLPDRELACAPIESPLGQEYLGAMRAAINCALANRQIITHLVRRAFQELFPGIEMPILYDVSHNTCKVETHTVKGEKKQLYVHRKGATRAFGPGHSDLPEPLRRFGQPVLIGGTMGTASYVLVGARERMAFSSACHGAGRSMSRTRALKQWNGRQLIDDLASRGIIVRSPSMRGVAEEAPGAYKDVCAVVDSADRSGLALKVARLEPLVVIKG